MKWSWYKKTVWGIYIYTLLHYLRPESEIYKFTKLLKLTMIRYYIMILHIFHSYAVFTINWVVSYLPINWKGSSVMNFIHMMMMMMITAKQKNFSNRHAVFFKHYSVSIKLFITNLSIILQKIIRLWLNIV